MELKKNLQGKELTVEVTGRVDTTTAPELEGAVKDEINSVDKIVVDFKNVDYISSAGLRVLLIIQKGMTAHGGKFVITHVKDEVMEVFDMTGFSSFLTIED